MMQTKYLKVLEYLHEQVPVNIPDGIRIAFLNLKLQVEVLCLYWSEISWKQKQMSEFSTKNK